MTLIKDRWERKSYVLKKYESRCAYCGIELSLYNFHLDHLIPKKELKKIISSTYLDYVENLMPSCSSCNCSKGTFELEYWRELIIDRVNFLRKNSSEYRIALRFGMVQEKSGYFLFHFEKFI